MLLVISGIPVDISKKSIKNMHLYVKPPNGDVTVSAPLSMSNEEIELFVHTKISWIKKQIKKFNTQLRQSKREYVSGETLYVWGKQYYLQIESGGRNSLELSGDKAIFTVRKNSDTAQREKFIREWYRKQLKGEIERLLPKWEKITGLKCNSWQIKYMTSRWGSCKPIARKISLNLQLAKKTPECLEYIILHELVHILEKHHNERFYSFIKKYMPKWKEIKSSLNRQTLDYLE
ncbi:M48 family metallopeptidase [Treponema sp. R80B11-R83G3]